MLQLTHIELSICCGLLVQLLSLAIIAFLNRVQVEVQQARRAAVSASLHPIQVDLALALGLNTTETVVSTLSKGQDRLVLVDESLQLRARRLQVDVAV